MCHGSQQLAAAGVIDVEVRGVDKDAIQQRLRVARELDRTRRILERELLHALPGRQIEHPDVLARILMGLDAAAMHDGVQPRLLRIHRELLYAAGTPTRLAFRVGSEPPTRFHHRLLRTDGERIDAPGKRNEIPVAADADGLFRYL